MRLLRNMPDEPIGDANRLTIYVVRDLGAVRKLHGSGGSKSGYGIAGFYIPRAEGSVAITPRAPLAATISSISMRKRCCCTNMRTTS